MLILLWMATTLFFWGIVYSSDPIWKKVSYGIFFLIINIGLLLNDHLTQHKMRDLKPH
jgi:hypothetical protein